jgi:hypothetical protein
MAAQEETGSRRTLPTVVATASLTLALGVTLAALGGYLTPTRSTETAPKAGVPTVTEAPTGAPAPSPAVVLVPVRETSPTACSSVFPEALPAAYRPPHEDDDDDDSDQTRGRTHHERQREHDDDDD